MSKFEALVVEFQLKSHPNADSLSIAWIGEVNGFQCVVKTEDFVNETLAVHIPIDAVAASDHPLLTFLDGKPVKACKLRGVYSHGLLIPISQVENFFRNNLKMSEKNITNLLVAGRNIAGPLRVKRWYSENRLSTGQTKKINDVDGFVKYTDIEHLNKYSDVLTDGEIVTVTEKIHGTSARFGLFDERFVIGSRNMCLDPNTESVWNHVFKSHNLSDKLHFLKKELGTDKVGIYGEIAGPKIQDLRYGVDESTLFVYDLYTMVDGNPRFLDFEDYNKLVQKLELKICPVLKYCSFDQSILDLRNGPSTLDPSHCREGIIIRPIKERYNYLLGRVIVKVIGEDYLTRKNQQDNID